MIFTCFHSLLQIANAAESDKRDLKSELELMKTLKPHPHVIKLLGCVTESGKLTFFFSDKAILSTLRRFILTLRRMAGHHQLFIKHLHTTFKSRRHHQGAQLQRKNAILLKVIEEICLLLAFPNAKYKTHNGILKKKDSFTDFRTNFFE